jgi:hypothetical protein
MGFPIILYVSVFSVTPVFFVASDTDLTTSTVKRSLSFLFWALPPACFSFSVLSTSSCFFVCLTEHFSFSEWILNYLSKLLFFHVRSLPVFPAFFFCSATLPPPYPLLFRVDFFLVTPHSWPIVGHGWGDQLGLFHDFDYCFLVWTPNSARSVLEMCFSSVFGSEWGVDSCWSHWGCRPSES